MKDYYFRVDAGNVYSLATGHLTRCLKLADYISSKEKADICFLMKGYPEGIKLVEGRYRVVILARNSGEKEELEFISRNISKGCFFICDVRGVGAGYVKKIKRICTKFVLFDDLGEACGQSDILINSGLLYNRAYNKKGFPGTDFLLGEKYFLLSRKLVSRGHKRGFVGRKLKVMASFGGADPCGVTEFFIENIVPLLKGHEIAVVLGPAFGRKKEVLRRYAGINGLKFISGVNNLDNLLLKHDIAFTCGGDTCIEACASGAVTMIISSIFYERKLAEVLHKRGMAYFVADIDALRNKEFNLGPLKIALGDRRLLRNISSTGLGRVDGLGLERVYHRIIK